MYKIAIAMVIVLAGNVQGVMVDFHDNAVIQEGDQYYRVSIFDDSIVVMAGGEVDQMLGYDSSTTTILGGQVGWFSLEDSATAHLYGGTFDMLYAPAADAYFHIYGYDLIVRTPSDLYFVSGYWADGTPFELKLRRADTFGDQYVLHEIPEPGTLILLGFGFLLFRTRRLPSVWGRARKLPQG